MNEVDSAAIEMFRQAMRDNAAREQAKRRHPSNTQNLNILYAINELEQVYALLNKWRRRWIDVGEQAFFEAKQIWNNEPDNYTARARAAEIFLDSEV